MIILNHESAIQSEPLNLFWSSFRPFVAASSPARLFLLFLLSATFVRQVLHQLLDGSERGFRLLGAL